MRCVLLILLAACTTHDEHHIEASWTIDHYGPLLEGVPIACPSGWSTAELVAIDPAQPDVRHVDNFPCSDGFGTSTYLPADSYISWIEIHDSDKLIASSVEETVPVTSFDPILDANIYVDAGYVEADWTPCDANGASQPLNVRLDVTAASGSPTTTFVTCSAGRILSPAMRPGPYTVTLGDGAFAQTFDHITVEAPNKVTRLGTFPIH